MSNAQESAEEMAEHAPQATALTVVCRKGMLQDFFNGVKTDMVCPGCDADMGEDPHPCCRLPAESDPNKVHIMHSLCGTCIQRGVQFLQPNPNVPNFPLEVGSVDTTRCGFCVRETLFEPEKRGQIVIGTPNQFTSSNKAYHALYKNVKTLMEKEEENLEVEYRETRKPVEDLRKKEAAKQAAKQKGKTKEVTECERVDALRKELLDDRAREHTESRREHAAREEEAQAKRMAEAEAGLGPEAAVGDEDQEVVPDAPQQEEGGEAMDDEAAQSIVPPTDDGEVVAPQEVADEEMPPEEMPPPEELVASPSHDEVAATDDQEENRAALLEATRLFEEKAKALADEKAAAAAEAAARAGQQGAPGKKASSRKRKPAQTSEEKKKQAKRRADERKEEKNKIAEYDALQRMANDEFGEDYNVAEAYRDNRTYKQRHEIFYAMTRELIQKIYQDEKKARKIWNELDRGFERECQRKGVSFWNEVYTDESDHEEQ